VNPRDCLDGRGDERTSFPLKECHPRCVYQNYSRSKIREVAVKNTTIFVGTIIYQLHVSALIGHLHVGIKRQRKISIIIIRMGGTRSRLQIYGVCGRIGVGASMLYL